MLMGLRPVSLYVGWGCGEVYRGKGWESLKGAAMWVFLAILAIPLIEIGLFVQLGGAIGLWPTLLWVIVSAGLGIIVLKGLLILPGFLTDAIGLLLLIPPVRLLVIKLVGRKIKSRNAARSSTVIIEGDWRTVDPDAQQKPNPPGSD